MTVPSIPRAAGHAAPRRLSLALQGGGSHGAFTWGVLERLLEDERIELDGLSGASAGAVNAVLVAQGMAQGGSAGARAELRKFWESLMTDLTNPAFEALLRLSRFLAPREINPLNLNPLRKVLAQQIDFDAVQRSRIRLFVGATEVTTGLPRIFGTREVTLEAVLASACLPSLYPAVQIDGIAYWDGGLTANPPVRPLVYQCDAPDVLMVLLQPERSSVPTTAEGIWARVNEISFTSTLNSELQGIMLAKQEAERGYLSMGSLERRLRRLNLHAIGPTDSMGAMDAASRLKTDATLLKLLHGEGRAQADAWLAANFDSLGVRSTLELAPHLLFAA